MDTLNPDIHEKIEDIARQFYYCIPLNNFQWHDIFKDLTYDLQDTLLSKTVNSELILERPIQTTYQKTFLKCLTKNLDKQGTEIHDNLYYAFSRLMSLRSSSDYFFKHYIVRKSGTIVSLKENVNLISDGTTGLRTWQASLALSEWILENHVSFKDKVILELGSGMGLTGLIIAMECSPSRMFFTDCHPSVLKTLCDNIALNIENISCKSNQTLSSSNSLMEEQDRVLYDHTIQSNVQIVVLNLPWENVDKNVCSKLGKINTVVAADIVYDSALFEHLIKAIQCLAEACGVEEFIFCCTERNPDTIETFRRQISDASFTIDDLHIPNQKNFIWPTDTPIQIFKLQSKPL